MLNREHEDYNYFYFLKPELGIGHNRPPADVRTKPRFAQPPKLLQFPPLHDAVADYTPPEAVWYWYFKTKLRRDAIHGLPLIDRQRYERLIAR